jgi:hypothetical protein
VGSWAGWLLFSLLLPLHFFSFWLLEEEFSKQIILAEFLFTKMMMMMMMIPD